jgi:hypothetical protein
MTLLSELGNHPNSDAMSRTVFASAEAAFAERSARFPLAARPEFAVPQSTEAEWDTPWGNAIDVLRRGAKSADEVALIAALAALGARHHFPSSPEQELATVAGLIWLAAHTPCNVFLPLDLALDAHSASLWQAVARFVEAPAQGGVDFGRTEALVAAASLRDSSSPAAQQAAHDAQPGVTDPAVRALLSPEGSLTPTKALEGELSPAPKSALLTALLAVTFVLAIAHVSCLIGRYVFSYKRPAKVLLSQRGLEVTYHTELLGKVLRERATLVPLSNLASVTREVRFARLGMYAGLIALVLGSYVGMGLFVDGLRVPGGSATLLGLAVVIVLVGLVIDFILSSLSDTVRGKCRILVIPRTGKAVCIGALSPAEADAVLGRIAEQARA